MKGSSWNDVPLEVWRLVLERLKPSTLLEAAYMCKSMLCMVRDNSTWRVHRERILQTCSPLSVFFDRQYPDWVVIGHFFLSNCVGKAVSNDLFTLRQWDSFLTCAVWMHEYKPLGYALEGIVLVSIDYRRHIDQLLVRIGPIIMAIHHNPCYVCINGDTSDKNIEGMAELLEQFHAFIDLEVLTNE